MRRFLTLLGATAAATLWVVGCGSDSSGPTGSAGGHGGSAGATGSAQCLGAYVSLTQSEFNAALKATGKCVGASDRVAVCTQDANKVVELCGGGCYTKGGDDAAQATCVTTCVNGSASPALSAACVDCYVADVACARDHCLLPCGIDPTGTTCAACRDQFNCAQDFFSCSGLPGPNSEPGAGGAGGDNSVPAAAGAAGAAGNSSGEPPEAGAGGASGDSSVSSATAGAAGN